MKQAVLAVPRRLGGQHGAPLDRLPPGVVELPGHPSGDADQQAAHGVEAWVAEGVRHRRRRRPAAPADRVAGRHGIGQAQGGRDQRALGHALAARRVPEAAPYRQGQHPVERGGPVRRVHGGGERAQPEQSKDRVGPGGCEVEVT